MTTTPIKPEQPIVTLRTDHTTRPGPVCICGYDPAPEHPECGKGELYAYVGQHIRSIPAP